MTPIQAAARCEDAIKVCNAAYEGKKEELRLADLALVESKKTIEEQRIENAELKESASAWYRNPYILFGLGALVGIAVTR